MDIVVNVNIEAGGEKPKVEVKQKQKPVVKKPIKRTGGVLQFPEQQSSSAVLDILGIKET